jgi:N-acetylneuraminate 9-O-acetyltransferase
VPLSVHFSSHSQPVLFSTLQIVLLVYHYFGIDSLYKPARLIVASYVWLTAYGNTVYFLQSGDVTAQRLLAVATRLCVLPVSLSLCLQQPLMLYYVIPQSLLTLFMTVVFFKINAGFHRLFHKASPDIIVQVASLISLSLLCFGVWDCGLLQRILSMVPDPVVSLPGLSGLVPFKSGHEWLFRTSLDHFMPVWGCATAVVMSSSQQQLDRIPSKLLVAVIPLALVTLVAWVVSVCPLHKLDFNSLHPFVGVIPITAFIIVRNATPALRSRYIPVFAWVGRHTLETYLFQVRMCVCEVCRDQTHQDSLPFI